MKNLTKKKISIIAISTLFIGITSQSLAENEIEKTDVNFSNLVKMATEEHDTAQQSAEDKHDHGDEKHGDESQAVGNKGKNEARNEADNEAEAEHEEGINLSPQKMALANIKVESITAKIQYSTVYAPGEIKENGYKSYMVSPRTESVIMSRHAILGEHVKKGQPLITFFSESMAQAQADYLLVSTEWQRFKILGNKTLSESRIVQAETAFSAAYGKLIAFGLTEEAIKDISNMEKALFGQYTLIARSAGVVLKDDFYQGQRVEAGDLVMLIADEHTLWVEAKVSPNNKLDVAINSPAVVKFGSENYQAKVIQEAHTIDPVTRTRIIRLSVDNHEDSLHSGMFAKIYFQFETATEVLAVPENALMRSADGDWIVFVEDHPGEFKVVEVTLGRALGDFREISGLEDGSRVVTQGAFFVASEIAKGGFDPHNH